MTDDWGTDAGWGAATGRLVLTFNYFLDFQSFLFL